MEEILAGLIRHRLDSLQSLQAARAEYKSGREMPPTLSPHSEPDFQFEPLKPGESIQDALKNREFESLEAANAFLQQRMGQYN